MILFYELYILGSLISYAAVSLVLVLAFGLLGLWMHRRFTFQTGPHRVCSGRRIKVEPRSPQALIPSSSSEEARKAA